MFPFKRKNQQKNKTKAKDVHLSINAAGLMEYAVFEMRHHYPCYPKWIQFLNEYLGRHDLKSFFANIGSMTVRYFEDSQYTFAFQSIESPLPAPEKPIRLSADFEERWFSDLLVFLLQRCQTEIDRLYQKSHEGELFLTLKNNGYLIPHSGGVWLKLNHVSIEMLLCLLCDVLAGEVGYHEKNIELAYELGHLAQVLEHQLMLNRNENLSPLLKV